MDDRHLYYYYYYYITKINKTKMKMKNDTFFHACMHACTKKFFTQEKRFIMWAFQQSTTMYRVIRGGKDEVGSTNKTSII
jgi:uncharacterized protein YmfQ (DUF2313 family)